MGWALIGLGISFDIHSVTGFFRARTTINPLQIQRSRALVVTGLYRFSRNPMYLGLVLALTGWALLLHDCLGLLVVWLFARALNVLQIAPEEAALQRRFGSAYYDYARRVHRWIGRRT